MEKDYKIIFNLFKREGTISEIDKELGKGPFSEVRKVKYEKREMVGKILEYQNKEKNDKAYLGSELRGQNIIKVEKTYSKEYKNKFYDLIIMEKALLRDLGKFQEYYLSHNFLKLIYPNPFDETMGDNILKFYAIQIINALKILDLYNFVHLDIKLENLLITNKLNIKLTDFMYLCEAVEEIKLPEDTHGFLSPEYFRDKYVSSDIAKKQDYFSIGLCLFIIKYGMGMTLLKNIKRENEEERKKTSARIIDLLIRAISHIKSNSFTNKDFKKFLISLIQYNPENRASFEQIYRSKWLNKGINDINKIIMAFEDEKEILMALQKSDHLFKKEKYIQKNYKKIFKFRFKKKNFNKI